MSHATQTLHLRAKAQVKRPDEGYVVAWKWCIMGPMERDWARLGRVFADAREAAGLTQVEAAKAIGVSRGPIQAIERGHISGRPFKKITGTMRSYARLVGWADGSIERVLDGGDPETSAPAPSSAEAPAAAESGQPAIRLSDLPFEIQDELGDGALLATRVVDLSPLGSDARMIVVVRGAPDATNDQLRRDLLAWEKAQRRLEQIDDEDTEPPAVSSG